VERKKIQFTSILSAGHISENGNFLCSGVAIPRAKTLADVLVVATDGPVHMRRVSVGAVRDLGRNSSQFAKLGGYFGFQSTKNEF